MWKSATPSPPLAIVPTRTVSTAGERVGVRGPRLPLTPSSALRAPSPPRSRLSCCSGLNVGEKDRGRMVSHGVEVGSQDALQALTGNPNSHREPPASAAGGLGLQSVWTRGAEFGYHPDLSQGSARVVRRFRRRTACFPAGFSSRTPLNHPRIPPALTSPASNRVARFSRRPARGRPVVARIHARCLPVPVPRRHGCRRFLNPPSSARCISGAG